MQETNESRNLSDKKYTKEDLKEMQSWSLERKIQVSLTRILEWYTTWDGQVYVSFSGGKDSTVLADLCARVCKAHNYKLVLWFSNTGLEYPEVVSHVKSFPNWLKEKYNIEIELVMDYPKDKKTGKRITFKDVILTKGYPIISKEQSAFIQEYRNTKSTKLKDIRWNGNKWGMGKIADKWKYLVDAPFLISDKCCDIMKKKPANVFEKKTGLKPIIGTMAQESQQRKSNWLIYGCNAFEKKRPTSQPLSIWLDNDILNYIVTFKLQIPSIYGEIIKNNKGNLITTGCERTGCVFCAYGAQTHGDERFSKLKQTHPKLWEYCMKPVEDGGLGMREVLEFINVKIE